MINATSCGRCNPQHFLGGLGKIVQAGGQDVAEAGRHPSLCRVASGEQLLDVKGVAFRTGDDRVGLSRLWLVPPDCRDELDYFAFVHRLQFHPRHERQSRQLG